MSIFILLHILIILLLQLLGFLVYKKYKNTSGIFFLMFCLIYGIWILLYTVIYSSIFGGYIILYLIKLMYVMSLIAVYNMIFFVLFFNKNYNKIKKLINIIFIIFGITFILTVFTSFFIKNITYIPEKNYYLENYGFFYSIFAILYIISTPIFIVISYIKIRSLSYINKMRLIYICIGFLILTILSNIFLNILPLFGKFYFIESVGFFIIPFLIFTFYSIHTYNFSNFKIGIGKIFIMLISSLLSIIILNVIREFYQNLGSNFIELWKINKEYGIVDFSLIIIFYIIFYTILSRKFFSNTRFDIYEKEIYKLKNQISYISSFSELVNFLENKINLIFRIKYINIKLFKKNNNNKLFKKNNNNKYELYKYFTKNLLTRREVFINDLVFLEENKHKFNKDKIIKQINKKSYLIFPMINNKGELLGIFELGNKKFKDIFYLEEIEILKNFVEFITGHLKYIEIYSKINDLNVNLSKKVDEKTLEYNNLLSKQREFISVSSHEIKTPIASAIFQIDCMLDDFKNKEFNKDYFEKELNILNEQLLKIGDLVNKIFKVQEYDIKEIKLFIERINLDLFLSNEIERFKKFNPKVKVFLKIEDNVNYIDIDKTQFTQIIDNLLNNAVKFSNKENLIIDIKVYLENDKIVIKIEDNGIGLKNIDTRTIFDKYVTGQLSSIGMGLGLYLCKRIINMHNGEIKVEDSKKLGGAKFIISIPRKNLK